MRTERISYDCYEMDEDDGGGNLETTVYLCPCGNGKIIEKHSNIRFRGEHSVTIECEVCEKEYLLDTTLGVKNWQLLKKA